MLTKRLLGKLITWIKLNQLLFLILIIASLLRLFGPYPGYTQYHPDEGYAYASALKMIKNLNFDPQRYDYPALIAILHAIIYLVMAPFFLIYSFIFSPDNLPRFKNVIDFFQQLLWQNQQTAVLYWARYITALVGIGSVYLTYKVAVLFFEDKKVGLIAAFLMAVNFRQVLNSHIALPDIYNTFFLLVCLVSFHLLIKKPTRRNYILSAIAVAVFFNIKFQFYPLVTFGLIHLLIWTKSKAKSRTSLVKHIFNGNIILSGLTMVLLTIAINPYHLLNWELLNKTSNYTYAKYSFGADAINFYALSYIYNISLGSFLTIFSLLGILVALRKKPESTLIFLSMIAPYLYIFLYYTRGGFYVRNFLGLTTLLIVFASIFIVVLCQRIVSLAKLNNSYLVILIIAVTLAVSFDSLKNSVINSYYLTQPRSMEAGAKWAEKNIPIGSKVVVQSSDPYPRNMKFKPVQYEEQTTFSISEMQDEGAQWGYLGVDWMANEFYWWMNRDPKDGLLFWNKPNNLLANMYQSVASQELAAYSVAHFVKPWQAPDSDLIIVKLPKKIDIGLTKQLMKTDFENNDFKDWNFIDGDDGPAQKIVVDQSQGKDSSSSLRIEVGSRHFPVIRAVSAPIPIQENKAYQVSTWIKTSTALKKNQRDGLIRVDFFGSNPGKVTLLTQSMASSVSSRAFGNTDWQKEELTVIPPAGAKYMTVSLQSVNANLSDLWFDDVEVLESADSNFKDPRVINPYTNYQLPLDVLFKYSQANL